MQDIRHQADHDSEKTPTPLGEAKIPDRGSLSSASNTSKHSVNDHGSVERISTQQDDSSRPPAVRTTTTASAAGPAFSVFTTNQKRFIVFMTSWAGFFSPVSGQIYFPALNSLARAVHVSNGLINLTLTSYMIFQGLAPSFIGNIADTGGRRPAYTICFVIYIAANIGLALQDSYAALLVLRCVQSSGSSATIAMASGVVADISTPAERGAYMGFTLAGSLLGPAIGPVLGGILAQFLGWRSIFWFLTILGAAFLVVFLIFFPETARSQVGNGSIPPKGWSMSLMNYLAIRKARKNASSEPEVAPATSTVAPKKRISFPNPFTSLKIIWDKENVLILFFNAFLFAAFYDITATVPSAFARIYHFNDLQIGLCFIPFGLGSMFAALINGQLLDRNFRRWCRKLGVVIKKGRDQDLRDFPIEKARLEFAFPASFSAALFILAFGWILDKQVHFAALLPIFFFCSFSMSCAFNVTSTLLVDFYPKSPATATAANNLVRCLLGAGAVSVIEPMNSSMGIGWSFTFLSLVLIITNPLMLGPVYLYGMTWREQRRMREEEARIRKEKSRNGVLDEEKGGRSEAGVHTVEGGQMEEAAVINVEQEEQHSNGKRTEAAGGLYRAISHDRVI